MGLHVSGITQMGMEQKSLTIDQSAHLGLYIKPVDSEQRMLNPTYTSGSFYGGDTCG